MTESPLKCRNTLAFDIPSIYTFLGRETWNFKNCKHLFSAFLFKNYLARFFGVHLQLLDHCASGIFFTAHAVGNTVKFNCTFSTLNPILI